MSMTSSTKARDCVNIAVLYALKHGMRFESYVALKKYVKRFYEKYLTDYFYCPNNNFSMFAYTYQQYVFYKQEENIEETIDWLEREIKERKLNDLYPK